MEKDTKQNEFINIKYGYQFNGAHCPELIEAEQLVKKYLIPDAGRDIMRILRRTQDGIGELGQYAENLEGGLIALERFRPEEYDTREGLKLKLEVMANIVKRTLNREPEFVTAPGSYEEAISKLGLAYAKNGELTEKLTERNLTLSDKLEELAEVKERVASLLEEQNGYLQALTQSQEANLKDTQEREGFLHQIEQLKNDRYALGVVLETTEYLAEETLQASYERCPAYMGKPEQKAEVDTLREIVKRIGTNAREAIDIYLRRVKRMPDVIRTVCGECFTPLEVTKITCNACTKPGTDTTVTIPLLISILERIEGRSKDALADYAQWKREEELPLDISNLITYLASGLRDIKKMSGEAIKGKDNYPLGGKREEDLAKGAAIRAVGVDIPKCIVCKSFLMPNGDCPLGYLHRDTYTVGVDAGEPGGDKTVFSVQQTPQAVRCNEDDIKPTYNPPIFFSGSCENLTELGAALIKGMRQAKARNTCGGCGATPGNPHFGGCPSLR